MLISKEGSATNLTTPITCRQQCICMQFKLNDEEKMQFSENFKRYEKVFVDGLKKINSEISVSTNLGVSGRDAIITSLKFGFDFDGSVNYKELFEVMPPIQKLIDDLKLQDAKDFVINICSEFGFSLNHFKPMGQFPIPAKLPLNLELTKRFGKAKLTTLGIEFDDSPIGLKNATIDYDEEAQKTSVELSVVLKPTTLDNLVSTAYEHTANIAKLFVVEKQ